MLEGDGVGDRPFDDNAELLQGRDGARPIRAIRSTCRAGSTGHRQRRGPRSRRHTSIGDGIFEGRADAAGAFDVQSLVVLTDGNENRPRWIADVAAQINETTYAVGLGTPPNTSAAALQTISGNNGGYLLITGATRRRQRFLLQKYFLQILAGISNADDRPRPGRRAQRGPGPARSRSWSPRPTPAPTSSC